MALNVFLSFCANLRDLRETFLSPVSEKRYLFQIQRRGTSEFFAEGSIEMFGTGEARTGINFAKMKIGIAYQIFCIFQPYIQQKLVKRKACDIFKNACKIKRVDPAETGNVCERDIAGEI